MKTRQMLPVVLIATVLARASFAAATPAQKCAAAKVKAAGTKVNDKAQCQQKALRKSTAVDSACLAKAEQKFAKAYSKADAAGGCAVTGDADTVEVAVDACLTAFLGAIAGDAKCAALKMTAVGKKASAKATCQKKAFLKGATVDSACIAAAEGKFNTAVGKADGSGTCTGAATGLEGLVDACLTSLVSPAPQQLNCTAANGLCKALSIAGDALAPTPFNAMADPSMRRDPVSGALWLAYSWAHIQPPTGAVPKRTDVVDLHLARSTDDGMTWTYVTPLWTSQSTTSVVDGISVFTSHEVINLLPYRRASGAVVWYSVNLEYLVSPGQYIYGQPFVPAPQGTGTLPIAPAAPPDQLAAPTTKTASLGFQNSSPALGATFNLSTDAASVAMEPSLANCVVWNEPALIAQGSMIYLAAQCLTFNAGSQDNDFYALFAANPEATDPLDPSKWTWTFKGKFAGPSDAQALASNYLVQMDLARKADGTILSIFTPAVPGMLYGMPTDVHRGRRVVPMSALDPPSLAHDPAGNPIVLATVTESDLPLGPGACTYEPTSLTGILITRRIAEPSMFSLSLEETFLRP